MAYIYKIVNDINDKIYVGKTNLSIEQRFKNHLHDAIYHPNKERRPLYRAINKYGAEHFHIELIEETNQPEEREIYWIQFYNSYLNGYNATKGGDGKHYADYDKIYKLFCEGYSQREISKIIPCEEHTCYVALKSFGVSDEVRRQRGIDKLSKPVYQIDPQTGEILNMFASLTDACRSLNASLKSGCHISDVCRGKRKTFYGYWWQFVEDIKQ